MGRGLFAARYAKALDVDSENGAFLKSSEGCVCDFGWTQMRFLLLILMLILNLNRSKECPS